MTDPAVRQEAAGALQSLFTHLGRSRQQGNVTEGLTGLTGGAMAQQLEEFMAMPVELAQEIINYATQLTELTLTTLEQAGITLIKGMTPL